MSNAKQKINFNVNIVDVYGEELKEKITDPKTGLESEEEIRLKKVIVDLLLQPYEGDDKLSGSERLERSRLAEKVALSSTATYTAKELEIIETLAAKSRPTIVLFNIARAITGEQFTPEIEEAA